MFRLQGVPESDTSEERRRTREGVISNFLVFGAVIAILRITPIIMSKINV